MRDGKSQGGAILLLLLASLLLLVIATLTRAAAQAASNAENTLPKSPHTEKSIKKPKWTSASPQTTTKTTTTTGKHARHLALQQDYTLWPQMTTPRFRWAQAHQTLRRQDTEVAKLPRVAYRYTGPYRATSSSRSYLNNLAQVVEPPELHYQAGEDEAGEAPYNARLEERYDLEVEPEGSHDHYQHHKEVQEHHHKEAGGKEMSYVYPILCALLILGALFVPFIALFFFLAVSAFNCSGGAGLGGSGGFSQVTPVFGRRRRRRRRSLAPAGTSGDGAAFARSLLADVEQLLGGSASASKVPASDWNLIARELPLAMLFDSLVDSFVGGGGAESRGHARATRRGNKSATTNISQTRREVSSLQVSQRPSGPAAANEDEQRRRNETRAGVPRQRELRWVPSGSGGGGESNGTASVDWQQWDLYRDWQGRLAKSTARLRSALIKFIDYQL